MEYTLKYKLEYVENYKNTKTNKKPIYAKSSQKDFSNRVREWVRIFELHGTVSLKHKSSNKEWNIEETFDLVSKVLADNSIKNTAIEIAINPGLLCSWVKNINKRGITV